MSSFVINQVIGEGFDDIHNNCHIPILNKFFGII